MYRAVIVVSQLCGGGGYKLIHHDIQNWCGDRITINLGCKWRGIG
jgi:hypothetical protein